MARKFDQQRARYLIRKLRMHGAYREKLGLEEADEAADMLEDLMMSVFGIQEKFELQEVDTKEKL